MGKFVKLASLLIVSMVSASFALATPAEVLIIRHAEKTSDADTHLSPRGEQRAAALPGLFTSAGGGNRFAVPNVIFGGAPHRAGGSVRSIETVVPLAQVLNLKIHQQFNTHQVADLVSTIMNAPEFDGKVILICWEHKRIPEIAKLFGVAQDVTWRSHAFDRILKLDFVGGDVRFADLPQELLPGDSAD